MTPAERCQSKGTQHVLLLISLISLFVKYVTHPSQMKQGHVTISGDQTSVTFLKLGH